MPRKLCAPSRALEFPTTTPVYYTVDYPAADGSEIDPYFRGVASVVPVAQVGAYGNYTTIDWLYQRGLATYFCESNAWPEPQGWHPQAQMRQDVSSFYVGGVHVDRLTVTTADFGQCRRYEQSDPRLFFSGTWTTGTSTSYSGGSYAYTNKAGSSVTLAFSGTSLALMAKKSPSQGKASVSVDGGTPVSVDLYRSATAYKQTVFSTTLPAGLHVVKITRAGTKNARSSGYTVNLDAASIVGSLTTFTRAEQSDTRPTYSGSWSTASNSGASGGTWKYMNASGGSVTVPFKGTSLAWVTVKSPNYGIAQVTLDGGTPASVDLYSASTLWRQNVWNTGTLLAGPHTVTIAWTGEKNPAAAGTYIGVDAFEVVGALTAGTRVEETDSHMVWAGTWTPAASSLYSGGSFSYANTSGASVTINFTGVKLSLIGTTAYSYGKMKVTLDGTTTSTIDLYTPAALYKQTMYSTGLLPLGDHWVTLEWTGEKNSLSSNAYVSLDAVDVIGWLR